MDWTLDRIAHIISTGELRTGDDNYSHRLVIDGLNAGYKLRNHMMTFQTSHEERLNG